MTNFIASPSDIPAAQNSFALILASENWAIISKNVTALKEAAETVSSKFGRVKFLADLRKREQGFLYTAELTLEAAKYGCDSKRIALAQANVDRRENTVKAIQKDIDEIRKPEQEARRELQACAIQATNKIPRVDLNLIIAEMEKISPVLETIHQMFEYENQVIQAIKQAGRQVDNDWGQYEHPGYQLRRDFIDFRREWLDVQEKQRRFEEAAGLRNKQEESVEVSRQEDSCQEGLAS